MSAKKPKRTHIAIDASTAKLLHRVARKKKQPGRDIANRVLLAYLKRATAPINDDDGRLESLAAGTAGKRPVGRPRKVSTPAKA